MQSDFTPNDPKGEAGSKKAPMWLIPPAAMEEVAWVHRLGSEKYGPFNWRKTGVCATTYVSAIMRHLNAWRDGEDLDPESGFSHIAHIATSCNILIDAARCGTLQDDRNKVPGGFFEKFKARLDEALGGMTPEELAADLRARGAEIEDPSVIGYHDATISTMPDGIEWLGGIYIDGVHRPYPPVPEGYDHWEYRGKHWDENRPARYGYWDGIRWAVYEDESAPCGSAYHYIEAVKKEPATGTIEVGDFVKVVQVESPAFFCARVEKVIDIRGMKVYGFDNGQILDDSEIYSITKLS